MKLFYMRYILLCVAILSCTPHHKQGTYNRGSDINFIEDDKALKDTVHLALKNEFYFKYDNDDKTKFGVEFVAHDLPIGQPSIALEGNTCYVVDAFHNNIKKIDLISGEVTSSAKLPGQRIWLDDIITFDGRVFVSSELDTIYVFSKNLELLNKKKIMGGRSPFVRKFGGDSLLIYFRDRNKCVTLDNNLKILSEKSISVKERAGEVYFKNKFVKRLGDELYQTKLGIFKAEINLFFSNTDFDSLQLVNLKQDSANLVLSVYDFR